MLSIVAGYLWLSFFTPLRYDLTIARWSAALSLIAFLIPAMFVTKAFTPRFTLTARQLDQAVYGILILAALTAAYASSFEFNLIGFIEGEALRSQLQYPAWLNYPVAISISTALPFSYAWAVHRQRYYLAAVALAIGASFYPFTLNKLTLLAPLWLVGLTVLSKFLNVRLCALLSLFILLSLGLLIKVVDASAISPLFRIVNFRMIAIPASGLDHYNHFFSNHPLTHFCQIQIIGRLFDCALPAQLGPTIAAVYATGNYNASLFATEGIAAVGPYFAPVVAIACGFVIAIGNKASAGLNQKFIFLSGSILALVLMNVPLSTAMLSHGAAILFALWFVTPREQSFEEIHD